MTDARPSGDDPTLPDIRRDLTAPVLLEEPRDEPLAEQLDAGEEDDPTSVAVKLDAWRRHYLPLPDELVHEYLGEDEYVVHTDHPSFRAFLIRNGFQVLGLGAAGLAFLIFVRGGFDLWTLLFFLVLLVILAFLALKRLGDHYTSYVITNLRLIRLSGIFGRKLASIPWTRMTGLGYRQKPLGRILGYATIFIESANEESGLREFSDINDPAAFHQRILDMISAKSGQSTKDNPTPTRGERKSFLHRRRERRTASMARARRVAREVARSRKSPEDAGMPDLAQPKGGDGFPKKGKTNAAVATEESAEAAASAEPDAPVPPPSAPSPAPEVREPPEAPVPPEPQRRGFLWPGTGETPAVAPRGMPKRPRTAAERRRRVTAPAPPPPATPPAGVKVNPPPPPPPPKPKPKAETAPKTPPKAPPPPQEERSPRVHRWWRNYRTEETTSARDALGALRQAQREARPARRVRLPSFGRPRSPLPESRQLPAKTEDPSEDVPDDGTDEES